MFYIVHLFVVELRVINKNIYLDYLIIHSSIIWDAISYTPDFVQESEDIYNFDLGLGKQDSNTNYEIGSLANNYVYNVCNEPNQVSYF